MEFFITVAESVSISLAILGIFWAYRCTSCLTNLFVILSVISFIYALTNFAIHWNNADFGALFHSVFIIIIILANSYMVCKGRLTLCQNRRRMTKKILFDDRRTPDD